MVLCLLMANKGKRVCNEQYLYLREQQFSLNDITNRFGSCTLN